MHASLEYPILDDADLTNMARECQLIHENVGWYFSPSQNKLVQQFQVKGGVVPMSTETKWNHPFELVKCLSGGLHVDHKKFITSYSPNTLDEETLKDGRERLTVFTDTGAVLRLTFNKEEGWLVEEVEFMKPIIGMSREEEIAAARALATGGPRKHITVTKELLKEYKTVAINRTEWKEVDKNYWVPWVTRISTESRNENVENEIRFREWKFGGDVDASLLDEANFTPEKIAASIDFKAIRDVFDRAK